MNLQNGYQNTKTQELWKKLSPILNDLQNDLIREHSELIKKHTELLEKDDKRITELEEQDRLVMQALFALLSHGIDGNDVEAMKKVKEQIQDYLILK